MLLRKILLTHRWKLGITYLLFTLEMGGGLLRPLMLGIAVNDLVKGSWLGLLYLSLVHLAWLVTGTLRQRYDTRTYSAIYTSLVTQFLARRYGQRDVSRLSAHSTLAREFVDFLEYDLVYVLEALYNIAGSLVLLAFYDTRLVGICLAVMLPVLSVSKIYGRRMRRLNRMKNDELEKQVSVIASGNWMSIQKHYDRLRRWQIRISDQEAWNFGIMELLVMLLIGVSLWATRGSLGHTILAGDLIGMYAYLMKFASGLDTIPYMVQRLASLQDISRRIEGYGGDSESAPVPAIGRNAEPWQKETA